MLVVEIVLAAVVVCGVAAVAMGYGGSITHFAPDWPGRPLPEDRTLRADDVTNARFSLAFRGYRMSEVDAVLDRLAFEINQRDARIEQLSGRPYESVGDDVALPVALSPEAEYPVEIPAEPTYPTAATYPAEAAPSTESAPPAQLTPEEPIFEQTYADNPFAPPRETREQ